MQNFYFIRHAQTEANKAQIMCGGGVDTPLTPLGIEQAHKAQEIFSSHHDKVPAGKIVHSNMQRTRLTASIINEPLNLDMIETHLIKEHIVGDWEGLSWTQIADQYIEFTDPPNGEKFDDFKARVRQGFDQALSDAQTPLIVAHGGVWRGFVASYALKAASHPSNAELYFFEYRNNQPFPWDVYHCHEKGQKKKISI